jgi:hypothetical protein
MKLLSRIDARRTNPGYILRGIRPAVKRSEKPDWQCNQDYWAEKNELDDTAFVYGT